MKKKILSLLAICLITLSCLSYGIPVEATSEYLMGLSYTFDDNLENDKAMYSNYRNYVSNKKKASTLIASTENKVMNDNLSNETKDLLNNEFIPLQLIQNDMDVDVIEEKQTNNVISSILYDNNNDVYFYVETNGNQRNLLFYINDYKYILEEENNNYYLLSENGERLNFIETTFIDEIENEERTIQPRAASWVLIASNLKKTNKSWVTVLSIISTATGGGSLIKGAHPILGQISFVTGVAALVGDQLYVTLYIKYSQSYRSDCTSYIKEVDDYYQNSNYTGFIKTKTTYFHSIKPDDADQNCMAY